ncbi:MULTISPECIES: PleD family two-component system response regulator [unclassified Devosia]|uniref:PleD family two-component system response regulator n=1 Tax=unclassified Devosia TaxID=196773 RepID=UPI0015F7B142|nr:MULTISPECIES: PleD family two-component system response regulator [unclassified Devosia]MBJ6986202.1 PleD family two-component system response regulator [Devosia sp. MC521]MBK1793001.1 PleD family two-component system response regulator [Devosia sp. WQ 349K1]QMW64313.1 PleD family two-component system response regulator [Devosia sp. MC521]
MTARVLIVDDIPTNVKLLEARLLAEYYDVVTANSGAKALAICQEQDIDIVLLDVMMPEMDGFEVCRRLKADPKTQHVPVLMITALDQTSDRVQGLDAGADDFLSKPVDDTQLLARVKSLVRLKSLTDELRARAQTSQQIAAEDALQAMNSISAKDGSILIVDTDRRHAERIAGYLQAEHRVEILTEPMDAVFQVAGGSYELALVSMSLKDFDPLRVCSQIRTVDQARGLPIILMADEADKPKVVRGLDLGINDYISRPVERSELMARVRTQIRRQRYADVLRDSVNSTIALAITDELTGLYNRRYFDRHMSLVMAKSLEQERDVAVMILDIDHFKSVNDNYGHDVGDAVIREFAARLRRNLRGVDMACRFGGEEFLVLMPDTDVRVAELVAERVREAVADRPFEVGLSRPISITISIGMALYENMDDTPEVIIKRADVALYRAKHAGRNRVMVDAA